jgi:serine/threonine-protein kinase
MGLRPEPRARFAVALALTPLRAGRTSRNPALKTCDACHRLYPDDGGFCPIDGQKLTSVAEATTPSDPLDPRLGSTVCNGRYQIWRTVADGGMGRVYQANDTRENRSVALKILHADVATDAVAVARFKREFACSAALPHDYIVEVLAFEKTEDGSFALAMEYLEGEELRMLLKREKVLSPERLVRMLSQTAIGLAAAHDRKIVHRDLKPDNVFLCGTHQGDRSKILDFGSVRDNSVGAQKLTVIGTTIGSPYYMSPEQAQALPSLDHRADVWSMAAITYECLTGTVPFIGSTGPAILVAILGDEARPPSEAGAMYRVPRTLDPVMEDALAKSADHRLPSVGALADRVGRAYGLEGDHVEWATVPQEDLAARIRAGVRGAVARYEQERARIPDTSAMDAAFRTEDPFKAGSAGGPAAFSEDLVMGVPKGTPRWIFAAVGAVAIVVGVVVALLFAR